MPRRRRFTASDLGISPDVVDLVQSDLKPQKRAKQGGPSKNEARYQEHLESMRLAGEVLMYQAQPEAVPLAHRCSWTPDFKVVYVGGAVELVEIKGARSNGRPHFHDDGARIKPKLAAHKLAGAVRVVVAWLHQGKWRREVIPV